MKIETRMIGPEEARAILTRNTRNRTLWKNTVAAYAADMSAGAWRPNGDTIKLAGPDDDVLNDGQHRLHAIIVSGTTQQMIVVSGLEPETQETIDTGRRRTFADALKLRGERNSVNLAALVRRVNLWERGVRRSRSITVAPTIAQLFDTLAAHPEVRDSLDIAAKVRRSHVPLSPGNAGMAHWLFARLDAEDCNWFFARLCDGANLAADHPVSVLRRTLINNALPAARGRVDEDLAFAYLIKAWNAYRDGRAIKLLRYTPGGANPESFPEPK